MGKITKAMNILNEAKTSKELSGYIDMEDPQTKATPNNPAIVVIGIGKVDYVTLKKMIMAKLKDLPNIGKKEQWTFLYKQIGKVEDYAGGNIESPLQAYIRTLIQVEEKMASGPYKRKLTLAKKNR